MPAWNAETTLARTLASLVHDNGDSIERVVVVVSGADRSAAVACRFERVDVVVLEGRASAGRARNVGRARASGADLLLFVDADCTLAPDGARALIETLRARGLGAVGAAIVSECGGAVAWVRHLLEFKEAEPGVATRAPRFLPSAALLVRADAFDRAGGFPDMWPGEDLVLCRRLAGNGESMMKTDAAIARHLHPSGLGTFLRHELVLGATAARARAMEPMRGSLFAGRPWLAPALLIGRFVRGSLWVVRHRPRWLLRFACLIPLYLAGLGAWTLGFARMARTEGDARWR